MISTPHFELEREYWKQGYTVIGIDEVGRGSLAGPITVGGVCFSPDLSAQEESSILTYGINDSKKLSARKREKLIEPIKTHAIFFTTASSDVKTINKYGIEYALSEAIAQIVKNYMRAHPNSKIHLLVDGRGIYDIPYMRTIKKTHIIAGDGISVSIASASILAKVNRDQYMEKLSGNEQYCWKSNKGYGTKNHREAIVSLGLTPHHRLLFVRKILHAVG